MNFESSFLYVFQKLLLLLDNVKIKFRHKAYVDYSENEGPLSTSHYALYVNEFIYFKKPGELVAELESIIEELTDYIKTNRYDLIPFLNLFSDKIEEILNPYKELIHGETTLQKLIDADIVRIEYYKLHSIDLDAELYAYVYSLGASAPEEFPKEEDISIDELFKVSRKFFIVLFNKLYHVSLLLRHEINLALSRKEKIETSTENVEYVDLIRDAKFDDLFKALKANPKYSFDSEIVQLSARFKLMEKDKRSNILSRDDYNLEINKLIEALFQVLTREVL